MFWIRAVNCCSHLPASSLPLPLSLSPIHIRQHTHIHTQSGIPIILVSRWLANVWTCSPPFKTGLSGLSCQLPSKYLSMCFPTTTSPETLISNHITATWIRHNYLPAVLKVALSLFFQTSPHFRRQINFAFLCAWMEMSWNALRQNKRVGRRTRHKCASQRISEEDAVRCIKWLMVCLALKELSFCKW